MDQKTLNQLHEVATRRGGKSLALWEMVLADVLQNSLRFETDRSYLNAAKEDDYYIAFITRSSGFRWKIITLTTHYCDDKEVTGWIEAGSYDDYALGCGYRHVNPDSITAFAKLPAEEELKMDVLDYENGQF